MRSPFHLLLLTFALLLAPQCDKTDDEDTQRPDAQTIVDLYGSGSCGEEEYTPSELSEYVLPYPVGTGYVVNLAHCGGSYHSAGQPDQYAIDFDMGIGTTITAAREGQVIFVEESGQDGGFPNNLVVVSHSDGTYGQYMHLTQNGALVEIGDRVEKGDPIGLSGNTGLAGYPHLHFVVTKRGSFRYPYESTPATFSNTLAHQGSLTPGIQYPALEY
ncbi:M23 family metallopeptidase [Flavobacteriaceae bacterium TP-CH-4]|uniref:M23 family metallopeptidase n=1 Tax=Pelagihabitans pacificus TaxID=2696054 RepID=A0A967E8Q4_9FLAO|nr:M23 family metallopeptidase [Pelagihabitans pacificus]NHF57781.1 M23 family metallopeptidase [Pelagihabitans pacificus]